MGGLKIHLPREINPEASSNHLTRTLRRKICEGIIRKVGKKIDGLTRLSVKPLDAELKLGTDLKLGTEFRDIKFREIEFREIEWMNFDRPFKKTKQRPFDAELRMGTEFREIKFRGVSWLNLEADLKFDH